MSNREFLFRCESSIRATKSRLNFDEYDFFHGANTSRVPYGTPIVKSCKRLRR